MILNKTGQEVEYKKEPYLPISSIGTDYNSATENSLPYGSALITDTSDGSGGGSSILKSKGITHIVHAAPNPRSSFTNDTDFINNIVKAVQNCIFLADREDIQKQAKINKLAICLVGGEIFLGKCDPQKLAEGIIQGAIDQFTQCHNLQEIIFVDYNKNPIKYFEKAILEKFAQEVKDNWAGKVSVLAGGGDIRDKSRHGAEAIVNAANINVKFGGGISGNVASETGNSGAIDQKAKEWIKEFYQIQKGTANETPPEKPDKDQNQSPKTCDFCSKNTNPNQIVRCCDGNGSKYYCSIACMLKQKNSPTETSKTDDLNKIRQQTISDIQKALNYKPKIINGELSVNYQNWENSINQTNSESEINDFHQKVLRDIMEKRKTKREITARDEKINSARTPEEKVNLLGEMGGSLGEHTPEQQTKLKQIKNELTTSQLREAIQKEINAQMTTFGIKKEELGSALQNQLEQLKNETNSAKIREIEKAAIQEVGEKFSDKKLINFSQWVNTALKSQNKVKIKDLKAELLKIISSPNSFLQAKKSQFQSLLQKLEQGTNSQNNNSPPHQPKFPWKVVISVSLVAVVVIIGLVIILRKRKLNQNPK